MSAALRRALNALSPVSERSFALLEPLSATQRFAAGSWLLRGGERAETCYFVSSGLVRELYLGDNGEQHTRAFVAEGHFTGSLLDLVSQQPSLTWIEALEPTTVLTFPYAVWNACCDREPELQRCARRMAELLYVRKARREYEMLALSAGQRYDAWLREHAALDARVQRQQLASYLGITPEHLSRLRRAKTRDA